MADNFIYYYDPLLIKDAPTEIASTIDWSDEEAMRVEGQRVAAERCREVQEQLQAVAFGNVEEVIPSMSFPQLQL